MPAPEFHFGMRLSAGTPVTPLMTDVFRSVLAQVGLTGEAAERLVDQLMAARRAAPAGECEVTFAAHAGELEIALSQASGDWRTSCPVPIR